MKRILLAVLLFSGVGLWSAPAQALIGLISCSVEANGVNFGSYEPLSGNSVYSTGSVEFECRTVVAVLLSPKTVKFKVYLDGGEHGSVAQRKMKSGSNTLNYNLYTDPGYNTIWDNVGGSGFREGNFEFSALLNLGASRKATYTIYGQVPGGQFVPAGNYGDKIIVTVLY